MSARLDNATARRDRDALREELRRDVETMRTLGVAQWGEIILGPAPGAERKALTPEEMQERVLARAQAEHDILFGATGTRPRIPVRGAGGR